jgi:hypothetical protein
MTPLVSPLRIDRAIVALLVGCAILTCGRTTRARMTAERETAVTNAILPLAVMYKAAWEQRRPEFISQFHIDDFEFYWNGTRMGDEIEDALLEGALTELEEYALEMIDPEVEALGPDEGVVSFRFLHREVGSTGSVREGVGSMRYVFERRDRGWKIVRIIQSGPVLIVPTGKTEPIHAARGSLPDGGLHYVGSDGHVGLPLVAELGNNPEICPLPWVATPRGIEGDLPPGLSFNPTDGSIEGTPLEAGTWTVRVTLDDVSCADQALDSVTVPVSFTIHN